MLVIETISKIHNNIEDNSLRVITFFIAIPFLLLADILISVSPVPSPSDLKSKEDKWRYIENFPLGLRF